jgi:hypothetical protein
MRAATALNCAPSEVNRMRHFDPAAICDPAPISDLAATVHVVLEDFGILGRAYRETDATRADAETVVGSILCGDYSAPAQVIAFNVEKGWARDVSEEIARALIERTGHDGMPEHVRRFVERHLVCLAY